MVARARRVEQAVDAPRVGRRLAREQVLGNALLRAGLLGEQLSGLTVAVCALRARELRIETAQDDRMDERQRATGLEDSGVDEQLNGFGSLARIETCKLRGLMKLYSARGLRAPARSRPAGFKTAGEAVDQSSDRPSERRFARRPRWPLRSERCRLRSARRPVRGRGAAFRASRADRRRRRTDPGAFGEPRLHKLGNGGPCQRRETDHLGGGIGRHGREQQGISARLVGASCHQQRDASAREDA